MVYIESHTELPQHPKTRKLARLLHLEVSAALGKLHMLWYYCMTYAESGDISGIDAEDIAEASDWHGEPQVWIDSLLAVGFLDRTEAGRIVVHDWSDYAGHLLHAREVNRAKQQRYRERQKSAQEEAPSPDDNVIDERYGYETVTLPTRNMATVPYLTVPNRTVPPSSALLVNGYQKSSSSKPAGTAGRTRASARTTTTLLKNLTDAEKTRWVDDVPDDLQASWSTADRREALEKWLAKSKENGWKLTETNYHAWLHNEKNHVPQNASEVETFEAILKTVDDRGICSNGQTYTNNMDKLRAAREREKTARDRELRRAAAAEAELVYLEPGHQEPPHNGSGGLP